MSAQVRTRGTLIITDYPAVCRCDGPRDGRGRPGLHYSEDPACRTNPVNTTTNQPR